MRATVLVGSVVLCVVYCGEALPMDNRRNGTMRNFPTIETFNFMKRFGYIEDGDGESEALFTEKGLEKVIEEIQKFGGIPQTGKLDVDTLKLMKAPRCGVPDVLRNHTRTKRYLLGSRGWNKRNLTFYVANWPATLTSDEVAKYIMLGLTSWGRYGRLNFRRVNDPNADIIVAFGSGYHGDRFPFDGPGNILAHAFFPHEYQYGGDIHFDNDEKWTTNADEEGIDFFTVAVHELGHSLGLSHSHVRSSIMFPYYTAGRSDGNLDYDDILGMYELYIKRKLEGDDTNRIDDESAQTTPSHQPRFTTTQRPYTTTTIRTTTPKLKVPKDTEGNVTVLFEGDAEEVDVHRKHDPKSRMPPDHSPSLPDICQGGYDAIATIRGEIFIFKEQYIWRLTKPYFLVHGYPITLHRMFPKLPSSIKKIDAAYERPDGMIILFTENVFWVYNGRDFIENSPKHISHYGLPSYLDKIDASFVWGKNKKTYLFRGDIFWRYNETAKAMDPGYPMDMGRWRGVPTYLDSATTFNGITYFFKGRDYWKFDNDWIIVTDSSPLPTPQTWLGCPKEE